MNNPPLKRKKSSSAASDDSKTPPDSINKDISGQENPALATITVTAVEVPELTEEEQRDRLHLERKVEKAVFEAGKALMELRDRRLYRSTHSTFEEYCKDRFGFQRRHPYRLIEASAVFDNLMKMCPICYIHHNVHNVYQIRI
ncbi:Site-specific DNA-cytosine methylase [Nostoc flagelliforme CCNUN1]|uniref:Site-specific DNA-cytosine methylase n=1 Tax=Nostoc flagelliforme CCNUN1 TaxID=2038116 RepID=A0A2K8T3T4_9NOSO|nr:Site-specific DNA-cytosine methylase [Nostoc flagelliforme CCNUN1]